jgi:hypothetical protein
MAFNLLKSFHLFWSSDDFCPRSGFSPSDQGINPDVCIAPDIRFYISDSGYQTIQGLLKQISKQAQHPLTMQFLNDIIFLNTANPSLPMRAQALGPKTDDALKDWYEEKLLPMVEGSAQYLYLDSKGNITTGKGILVLSIKESKGFYFDSHRFLKEEQYSNQVVEKVKILFLSLEKNNEDPFRNYNQNVHFATPKDRDAAIRESLKYLATRIQQGNYKHYKASFYDNANNPVRIDSKATDAKIDNFLDRLFPQIRKIVPGYSQFPAGAQLAILDMAYNTDPNNWKKVFIGNFGKKTKKPSKLHPSELHPFYEIIHQPFVNWNQAAFGEKNYCNAPDSSDFYFWRWSDPQSRNEATQILLILAKEWQQSNPSFCSSSFPYLPNAPISFSSSNNTLPTT